MLGLYDLLFSNQRRNIMKKLILLSLLAYSFLFVFSTQVICQTLKLSTYKVNPGENIQVIFTAPSSFASNAWIGIVPSSVRHGSEVENDKHDLGYQYLKKRTFGTMEFRAPIKPGNYDFRMNDSDSNGREVVSVSFEVSNTHSDATTVTPIYEVNFDSSWKVEDARNGKNRDYQSILWTFSPNGTVFGENLWRGLWERAGNNKIRIILIDKSANTDEFDVTFFNNGREFIATKNGKEYRFGKKKGKRERR